MCGLWSRRRDGSLTTVEEAAVALMAAALKTVAEATIAFAGGGDVFEFLGWMLRFLVVSFTGVGEYRKTDYKFDYPLSRSILKYYYTVKHIT